MNQKTVPPTKRLGVGSITTIFTFLGALLTPLAFVVFMVNGPAYQNGPPEKAAVLVFGVIPFFLGGAVGGALFGVALAGIIFLAMWLRQNRQE